MDVVGRQLVLLRQLDDPGEQARWRLFALLIGASTSTRMSVGLVSAIEYIPASLRPAPWREGPPLTVRCQSVDLQAGLHPPTKSVPNEKRIPPSAGLPPTTVTHNIGQ